MKHQPVKASEVFKNKGKKNCPRCGDGVYLAQHKNRMYCGKCHYAEFMNTQKS